MSDTRAPEEMRQRPVGIPYCRGWKVAAASVRGTSHEKAGMVCQDSHQYRVLDGDILIAAISDGAGSAAKAEQGAEAAVVRAVEAMQDLCAGASPFPETDVEWAGIMRSVLASARGAVETKAEEMSVPARDLACTLIVLLTTPAFVVAAQIGDGAAVVGDVDGGLFALTTPQSGEYLNETTFLISPQAVEQAQTAVWRGDIGFLAAFSDGLQMLALKMSEGAPHPPFFAPLFRFLQEQEDMEEAARKLSAFLISPRIVQRVDDDLTLLVAHWPR